VGVEYSLSEPDRDAPSAALGPLDERLKAPLGISADIDQPRIALHHQLAGLIRHIRPPLQKADVLVEEVVKPRHPLPCHLVVHEEGKSVPMAFSCASLRGDQSEHKADVGQSVLGILVVRVECAQEVGQLMFDETGGAAQFLLIPRCLDSTFVPTRTREADGSRAQGTYDAKRRYSEDCPVDHRSSSLVAHRSRSAAASEPISLTQPPST
jgi:hypothetical protein